MATIYDQASLVMIPSGYKDDKLFSIKPTDGSGDFTFSRDGAGASPATRVNASGYIEKGYTNDLLKSNTFDHAVWGVDDASVTGGQSGYDGTSNAWKLVGNTNASRHHIAESLTDAGINTFSLYAKASGVNYIQIASASSIQQYANFDLSDGSIGDVGTDFFGANAEDIGGGWYRISVVDKGTTNGMYISLVSSKTAGWLESWSMANATDGVLIQDAQSNLGLVAQPYVETDSTAVSAGLLGDMPRLDYSGGATCPSLLLEPSRVNLYIHSEALDLFSSINQGSFINNQTTSPEGFINAGKLLDNNSGGSNQLYIQKNFTISSGVDYTASMFFKKDQVNYSAIRVINYDASANNTCWFDLENGVVATDGFGDSSIEDYGNGWYRCIVHFNTTTDVSGSIFFYACDADNVLASPSDGTTSVFAWGGQLESGSYPTSYIPTYGSASTRGADSCSLSNGSSLPTSYPFTMYIEAPIVENVYGTYLSLLDISQPDNYYQIALDVSDKVLMRLRPNGTITSVLSSSTYTSGTIKIAAVFTASSAKLFINGTAQGSTTSVDTFNSSVNDLIIGQLRSVSDTGERLTNKQSIVFNSALTDAECIALTTI